MSWFLFLKLCALPVWAFLSREGIASGRFVNQASAPARAKRSRLLFYWIVGSFSESLPQFSQRKTAMGTHPQMRCREMHQSGAGLDHVREALSRPRRDPTLLF